MMGDRDYRSVINNTLESLGKELQPRIDAKDANVIHLSEVVRCLRRAYYDRTSPINQEYRGFSELIAGLLHKLQYGAKPATYEMGDISLRGEADMVIDDLVIIFRPADQLMENPRAGDMLYLNACMWMYNKYDGIIVYVTGDRHESSFSLTRSKHMFEETVRRVRVLSEMLPKNKTPILEPSVDCEDCQYYQRCFTRRKESKTVTLASMLGLSKNPE